MRSAHWLRPNRSCETLHDLIVVDTETTSYVDDDGAERQRLWFGWAAFTRRLRTREWSRPAWQRFDESSVLWDFIESRLHGRSRLFLLAHNWSFDALVTGMFDELPRRGWKMEGACLDGPPIIIRWRRRDKTIMVLDSLNWWRDRLANLETAAGLPKLRMPDRKSSRARWDAYCRRDVRVVLRMITRWADFLLSENLGGFAPTLAAQALRSYRHKYMDHPILIDDSPSALALARDAYMGGRTECFRIGKLPGKVTVLDVNSMYPAVMATGYFPTKLISVQRLCTPSELKKLMRKYCVVAECDIEIDVPCLPLAHEGRLVFPVGRLRGSWCGPELALAFKHGRVVRVHRVAIYERARIFERFVADSWAQRQAATRAGDKVRSHQWKILMNSLYGKFGQRGRRWVDIKRVRDKTVASWTELDADTGEWVRFRRVARTLQMQLEEGEARESHPAIAGHVTSYARALIWSLILEAGREHVHYTDTDSLWVDASGLRRLRPRIDPNALGALKVESSDRNIVVHGPKDYVKGGRRRIKGIRDNAVEITPGVFVQPKWRGLAGAIAEGDLAAPKITGVMKFLARNYTKGRVLPSGRVEPLLLTLW